MIQVALHYTHVLCNQCYNLPEEKKNIIPFKKKCSRSLFKFQNADKNTTKWHILLGLNCHSVDLDMQQS